MYEYVRVCMIHFAGENNVNTLADLHGELFRLC